MPATQLRMLTKADITGAKDLESEIVHVPEWDGSVRVLALDVNRRQAYFAFGTVVTKGADGTKVDTLPFALHDAALAVLSIVDEHDEPLFTLAEIEALGTKNPAPIIRIAGVARRLSKLRAEDREEAKAAADPTNGASPSASPATSE